VHGRSLASKSHLKNHLLNLSNTEAY